MQDRGIRVNITHEDVKMDILGDIRDIPAVKVSYVKNADGTVSRCMSFQEYNRIADEIHRQLRAKRKVYSEREQLLGWFTATMPLGKKHPVRIWTNTVIVVGSYGERYSGTGNWP